MPLWTLWTFFTYMNISHTHIRLCNTHTHTHTHSIKKRERCSIISKWLPKCDFNVSFTAQVVKWYACSSPSCPDLKRRRFERVNRLRSWVRMCSKNLNIYAMNFVIRSLFIFCGWVVWTERRTNDPRREYFLNNERVAANSCRLLMISCFQSSKTEKSGNKTSKCSKTKSLCFYAYPFSTDK